MSFEDNIKQAIFSQQTEKTFVDKVLAKDDTKAIQELVKKPKLTRSELLELLYLVASTEAKLVNYSEWERYVILKFFVWIREFTKIAEILYDYQDDLELKEAFCYNCKAYVNLNDKKFEKLPKCSCEKPDLKFKLSLRTKKLLSNNERLLEHDAKFLVDLYLNIARTSLSLSATGFMNTLTNKFEFSYPNQTVTNPTPEKTGFSIFPIKKS
jgi:hypothetical protein